MTELEGMRSTLAEIAVTLVGFSVIFQAFTGRRNADDHSYGRVSVIVEMGLAVVALCFLPELLTAWGVARTVAFSSVSGLTALYWIRWLALAYQIKSRSNKTPVAYWAVVSLHFIVIVSSAANAITIRTDALYTTVVFAALTQVGITFLAQFRAERDSGEPAV